MTRCEQNTVWYRQSAWKAQRKYLGHFIAHGIQARHLSEDVQTCLHLFQNLRFPEYNRQAVMLGTWTLDMHPHTKWFCDPAQNASTLAPGILPKCDELDLRRYDPCRVLHHIAASLWLLGCCCGWGVLHLLRLHLVGPYITHRMSQTGCQQITPNKKPRAVIELHMPRFVTVKLNTSLWVWAGQGGTCHMM